MTQHDSETKPSKRRLTIARLLLCGGGGMVAGLSALGLRLHLPLTALLSVFGVIGLSLLVAGVLASDETCDEIVGRIVNLE